MIKRIAVAVLVASLGLAAGCQVTPKSLAKTISTDGSYIVGEQIWPGTWKAANIGPHEAGPCRWTIVKKSSPGTVLRRSADDTGKAIQEVNLRDGEIITVEHCGPWARLDK